MKGLKNNGPLMNSTDIKALHDVMSQLTTNGGAAQLKKLISSINADESTERRRVKELADAVKNLEAEAYVGRLSSEAAIAAAAAAASASAANIDDPAAATALADPADVARKKVEYRE